MTALIDSAAPFGFRIYRQSEAHHVMHLAGDRLLGICYMMSNLTRLPAARSRVAIRS
jgi:hypothetical protein